MEMKLIKTMEMTTPEQDRGEHNNTAKYVFTHTEFVAFLNMLNEFREFETIELKIPQSIKDNHWMCAIRITAERENATNTGVILPDGHEILGRETI